MPSKHTFIGLALLIAAFSLHAINRIIAPMHILAVEGGNASPISSLISFIFKDLGIGAINIVLVCLGGAYLVFGEMVSSLISKKVEASINSITNAVDAGFKNMSQTILAGVVNLETDIILNWIKNNNANSEEYRKIGLQSIKKHYGSHADQNDGYIEYVTTQFLDKTMPQDSVYRANLDATIKIDKDAKNGFTKWSEVKTYYLITHGVGIKHVVHAYSSFPIGGDQHLSNLLEMDTKLYIEGHEPIEIDRAMHADIIEKIEKSESYLSDDGFIEVRKKNNLIEYIMKKEIVLNKQQTRVELTETSLLAPHDHLYSLTLPEPVKGFSISFVASNDFVIDTVAASAARYDPAAGNNASVRGWPHNKQMVTVKVDRWILPGICMNITWRDNCVDLNDGGG